MQHYMGRFGRAHGKGLEAEKRTHPAYYNTQTRDDPKIDF
jgi:hypothetical protein